MFAIDRLSDINQFTNPLWLCTATNLRGLANEFANSPLRQEVRLRAQTVDIATLNAHSFSEMIQEVFSVSLEQLTGHTP